ncbi:AMP-binding protein [Gordonia soli]|uniref:Carrier domain-containing protein n=1 Tax=Gordonia soli NBRC 108243 TaxID=1223545 RepID=M0QEP5_9ACTN|nr:AMP-binding protein [Gordonia soli]GAC66899.1 hypothetical protein GS4_05_01080 [Gordonia soli NBRC 108243]
MPPSHNAVSNLCARFLQRLAANPLAPAVLSTADTVSFATLGRAAAAVQRALTGASPRTVGLYSPPSADLVAAAWGALSSGVPYVPLSPTYPDDRLRFMVSDADVDVILAPADLVLDIESVVVGLGVTVVAIPGSGVEAAPRNLASSDGIAYILYTSGSTGTPKGVEITHAALDHQLSWIGRELELGPGGRIVHKTPISFDAAQWELLANVSGAAVVAAGPEDYRDPLSLAATVIGHRVTHLQVVPTLLQALCEEPEFAACTSVRLLASGGEALPGRLATLARSVLPSVRLINLYGPTETTINAAFHEVTGAPGDATVLRPARSAPGDAVVAIGTPVDGLAFHLLGEDGQLTDRDSGELAIAGPQLAAGYRHRPEETDRRFVVREVDGERIRLYRTGDRVHVADGVFHFRGRVDNQVKLRGYRVELDEIRSTLEAHDWVRHAGVFTTDRPDGAGPQLSAYVELNPHEASLMDQGVHGAHHQSKASRVQVRAQIAGLGVRDDHTAAGVRLDVDTDQEKLLYELAFSRKTYRTFASTTDDLDRLADLDRLIHRPYELPPRTSSEWTGETVAFVLRSLTQQHSAERLLPKYAYASPGALYGVQVYVRVSGVAGFDDAVYYLNPRTATVHPIHALSPLDQRPGVELTLVGQRSVISSVYSTNVDEVLRFEAGHLLGLLDTVAPATGHIVGAPQHRSVDPALLGGEPDDRFVIGTWSLPAVDQSAIADRLDEVDHVVELFTGAEDSRGVHRRVGDRLVRTGPPLLRRKDVIAINQRVHDQASFGVILTSTGSAESYIDLGRALQRLQHNQIGIGLMSSGYSSFSGNPLAAARRVAALDGASETSSAYVALGGPITADQIAHTGMDEDALHTQGPTEIITTDVAGMLPHYMLPDVIRIVDELPRTPNGKIDLAALRVAETARAEAGAPAGPFTAPASLLEHQLAAIWAEILGRTDPVSTTESFFALGGNSIHGVRLTRALQAKLGVDLPVQAIFEFDTIVKQAQAIADGDPSDLSRAVPLAGDGDTSVFVWPGLGGYPMNLRTLANAVAGERYRWYGIQAGGLNPGEAVDADIVSMARSDIDQIRRIQPHGPYHLIGYSFGARVAFETAYQLEAAGERVARLVLLAPGSPALEQHEPVDGAVGPYRDDRFTRVLYSVFAARTDGAAADRVVAAGVDRESFLAALATEGTGLDRGLAERITRLVEETYSFEYSFEELVGRRLDTDVTVIRASGDDYSFLDAHGTELRHTAASLLADHYQILRDEHINATAVAVTSALSRPIITELRKEKTRMPHVAIKHFPASFTDTELNGFVEQLSALVRSTFQVDDSAVSVSLEAIQQEQWDADVYQPEIVHRKEFLVKAPGY